MLSYQDTDQKSKIWKPQNFGEDPELGKTIRQQRAGKTDQGPALPPPGNLCANEKSAHTANDKPVRVMSAAVFLITKHYQQPRERAGSIYIMWSILPETLLCGGGKEKPDINGLFE